MGILAHVDAGKTTLTEQLLHAAGVIDHVGRVDDGTTQTDSLALERERGITIKSAVVSFIVDGVTINLVDTPGHSDFVAEVERVLGVLDGAVLVVSAVEGVQPQTLLLHRALRRLGVPTIVFVNKIDRVGADVRRVIAALGARLGISPLAMAAARDVGTKRAAVTAHDPADPAFAAVVAEVVAAHDDALLQRYVEGPPMPVETLRRVLADQVARSLVVPVYAGAALGGVGVDELLHAIPLLLPPAHDDRGGAASGTVFKIERGANREKLAVVRVFAGTLRVRERLRLGDDHERGGTVTAIDVFDHGTTQRRDAVHAGEIAKLHGLTTARIGDTFGPAVRRSAPPTFARPTLETAVVPRHSSEKRAVFDALSDLAEQDPLIDLRQDDTRGELFLSLYGEVQQEVVAQTLQRDHGLEIEFRPTTPVCVERPTGCGRAIELIGPARSPAHPFLATVGLAVSPLPPGTGVTFELDVSAKAVPIHVFGSVDAFRDVMQRTVRNTLGEGLHGWEVVDCRVVMTDCDYQAPPRKWPGTTLSDYRLLTPLVLMAALRTAGTTVLEPVLAFRLEFPAPDLGPVMAVLGDIDAEPSAPATHGPTCILDGVVRVARLHDLQSRVPDLTHGEGVLETTFAGYRPVRGAPPRRPRTDRNPLDRDDYLRRVSHGTAAAAQSARP